MSVSKASEMVNEKPSNQKLMIEVKRQIPLHLMMAPSVILATIFSIVPLFGIIIAFQDFSPSAGIFKSQFVDFYNFTRLFMSG